MRTSAQLAKYGRLTGCPARDYPGSVDIRVLGVPTRQASECRLVGPVLLIGVPAFGALPAGIPRVHGNQRNARQLCFVDQELPGLTNETTIDLMKEINKDIQLVITSTSGIFPDNLRDYENIILMRRPLKISWLPDLINESVLKQKSNDI